MLYIFYRNITFEDVARGLQHALAQIGIKNTRLVSSISAGAKSDGSDGAEESGLYILFGVNDYAGALPVRYIVYQLEQFVEGSTWFSPAYINILKRSVAVLDYSFNNIVQLRKQGITNIYYLPLGYMNVLDTANYENASFDEIERDKDIDVLFVGSMNERRKNILDTLKNKHGLNVVVITGGFWRTKDDGDPTQGSNTQDARIPILKRAKVVLNVHYYDKAILEIVRLSYFLSNKAFVVSEASTDRILDRDYGKYCKIATSASDLYAQCVYYTRPAHAHERLQQSITYYTAYHTNPYFSQLQRNTQLLELIRPYDMVKIGERSNERVEATSGATNGATSAEVIIPPYRNDDIKRAECGVEADGVTLRLKLPYIDDDALPYVSIVTPTYNRYTMFPLAIHNFHRFAEYYPAEKLEWVIVDDSDGCGGGRGGVGGASSGGEYQPLVRTLLPTKDKRIKYVRLNTTGRLSIGMKRNLCAQYATHAYIVHMDDDDIYFPTSVRARVVTLLKYASAGVECVGTLQLGIYHMGEDYGYVHHANTFGEATMAYTKHFWDARHFDEFDCPYGEGVPFTNNRRNKLIDIPFAFNMIAVNHKTNVTGQSRLTNMLSIKDNKILDLVDTPTRELLKLLKSKQ